MATATPTAATPTWTATQMANDTNDSYLSDSALNTASSATPTATNGTSIMPSTVATDASAATSDSGGLGSILSGLGSDVSSFLGSDIGALAEYGGLYSLISSQASATQSENNSLAGQISAIGQGDVTQGASLLSSYGSGQLATPYQTQLNATEQTNQNNAISQNQQVAQLLANSGGGQNVQGAQASESQQIQNTQSQLNTQAMATAFSNELSDSLALTGTGGAFVQSGIQQEIASNTALQQQLSSLMGSLAQAYAKQVAGNSSSTSSAGTTGSVLSAVKNLLNGGSSSGVTAGQGTVPSGLISSANNDLNSIVNSDQSQLSGEASSLLGESAPDLSSSALGVDDLESSLNLGDDTDDLDDLSDFSSAGGQAAASGAQDLLSNADIAGSVTTDTGALDSSIDSAASGLNLGSTAASGSSALSDVSQGLGDLGDVGGIASAVENPGNVVGDLKGGYDAYKLGSSIYGLASGDTAANAAGVAGYASDQAAAEAAAGAADATAGTTAASSGALLSGGLATGIATAGAGLFATYALEQGLDPYAGAEKGTFGDSQIADLEKELAAPNAGGDSYQTAELTLSSLFQNPAQNADYIKQVMSNPTLAADVNNLGLADPWAQLTQQQSDQMEEDENRADPKYTR